MCNIDRKIGKKKTAREREREKGKEEQRNRCWVSNRDGHPEGRTETAQITGREKDRER